MKIAAITCFFNPVGYEVPIKNYYTFRDELTKDIHLYTAELVFQSDFQIPGALVKIRGDEKNLLWQKERLLNILIEKLKYRYDAIVWLDADIIFDNDDWLYQTQKKLEKFSVVQLFETVGYLSSDRKLLDTKIGCVNKYLNNLECYGFPGFGWAARVECLPDFGLYDRNIVGASDSLLANAWLPNLMHPSYLYNKLLNKEMAEDYSEVQNKYLQLAKDGISYIEGIAYHLYHGSMKNRDYLSRNKILLRNKFNPKEDIKLNENGIWEWSSNKPDLHSDVRNYFLSRKEDEICFQPVEGLVHTQYT